MKVFGIILLVIGVIGFVMGCAMFGDIGIAAWVGAFTALVTGIGFLRLNRLLLLPKKE